MASRDVGAQEIENRNALGAGSERSQNRAPEGAADSASAQPDSLGSPPKASEESSPVSGLDSTGVAPSIFRHLWEFGRGRPKSPPVPGSTQPDSLASLAGPSQDDGSLTPTIAPTDPGLRVDPEIADDSAEPLADEPLGDSLDSRVWPSRGLEPIHRISKEDIDGSTERRPRELLTWLTPLRTLPSGTYHTPDPIDWGDLPGREPPAVLLDGMPVAPPGYAEASPDPLDPLWAEEITIRHATPLRLPNNPGGGPLLDYSLLRPDSLVVLSGVRLSDGSTVSNTDAFYLVRPGRRSLTHVLWADHKSAGRIEYGSEAGQDVLLRHERSTSWGRWALGWQSQLARQRVFQPEDQFRPGARWLWDRSAYVGLIEGRLRGWEVRVDAETSWHRSEWEGSTHPARRKDGVTRGLAHLAGPGRQIRPRVTLQVDRHHWRYFQPGRIALDRRHTGLGLAAGVEGVSRGWLYEVSAGRSDPGSGSPGWTAAMELQRRIDAETEVTAYAARGLRTRLIPRMSNDLEVMVGQGVAYPVVSSDPPNETLWQGELRAVRHGASREGAVTVRATQIDNAVSLEDAPELLTPATYLDDAFPDSALGQTLQVVSLRLEAEQRMRWGFEVRGTGWLRASDPGWRDQLWATPAEIQGDLSWKAFLFQEGLLCHGFVRGSWSSSRATAYGLIAPQMRLDGGASAGVGAFRVYLLFVNLLSSADPAAAYVIDFVPQPLRSYRLGLTWRFLD